MENTELPLPELWKLSGLISAVRDYALKSARDQWSKNTSDNYITPCLDSWDAFAWFELANDWDVVNYLLSGTTRSRRLMRSLYYCLKWYGQSEIDRLQSMENSQFYEIGIKHYKSRKTSGEP
jgi:hypothetical protein